MPTFNDIILSILGRSNIKHAKNNSGNPRILHISDTPTQFYPELKRIIKAVDPEYIIHTGDFADNLKIGLYKSSQYKYKVQVKKLFDILRLSNAKEIVLTLGNHDAYDFIREHVEGMTVFEKPAVIELEGKTIALSHYSTDLENVVADIRLFGHDTKCIEDDIACEMDLNGIMAMSLIDLGTLDVSKIDYPIGTDNARLNRKMGI